MVEHCYICGSSDIKRYDRFGYECNFCQYNSLYDTKRNRYSLQEIFIKNIGLYIEYKKDKCRYITLNGKSLRKYKANELDQMRNDYRRIVAEGNRFISNEITYEYFIDFIMREFNQFDVKFYNRQQCEVFLGINERKEIIKRMTAVAYDNAEYLVISVDMVQSSNKLSDVEENINDVSELFRYLNDQFHDKLKYAYNKRLTGDGFIALFQKKDIKKFLQLVFEIHEIETSIASYIHTNKLNIKNDYIRFGIAIDVSKVIIIYGKEDLQIGLSINRTAKLSKIHVRDKYYNGIALTTLRFANYASKWIDIYDKKEEQFNKADVYYIEKNDIDKVLSFLDV
ncbi:MAG: hypothetical protein RBQ97_04775 [Acholeplasma sp.]|nr:hypothetical protein [Acholeplasma sp.]